MTFDYFPGQRTTTRPALLQLQLRQKPTQTIATATATATTLAIIAQREVEEGEEAELVEGVVVEVEEE